MWFLREKPPKRLKQAILARAVKTGTFFYPTECGVAKNGDILANQYGRTYGLNFRLRRDGTGDYDLGDVTWEYVDVIE